MNNVKWTNTYEMKVDTRTFRLLVGEDIEGGFHANCIWYEEHRLLKAPGQAGSLTFQLEQRHAVSESEAVDQIMQWAKEKFSDSLVELRASSQRPVGH